MKVITRTLLASALTVGLSAMACAQAADGAGGTTASRGGAGSTKTLNEAGYGPTDDPGTGTGPEAGVGSAHSGSAATHYSGPGTNGLNKGTNSGANSDVNAPRN